MRDPRADENLLLGNKLGQLGMGIKDIKADGHCLYRWLSMRFLRVGVGSFVFTTKGIE